MNTNTANIVIVGAGQSGAWVARSARETGFGGTITLIGDESHLPYERPPLSKAALLGTGDAFAPVFDRAEYDTLGIRVEPGRHVTSIDRAGRCVICSDGTRFPYDRLALATGGRAARPRFPGSDLPGVLTLRTLEDAAAIAQKLRAGGHALIVGGGWIGLETAAAARQRGMSVTLLEAAGRLCARSLPPFMSAFLLDAHRRHGVDVRTGASLATLEALGDGRLAAVCGDGAPSLPPADVVVLGVGLTPRVDLAIAADLRVDKGIVVDATGATSDPAIFAAGDVACLPLSWHGGALRLESWANAQNHGMAVGRSMAGQPTRYDDLPWFWSDQYDMNIQMAGLFAPGREEILRGDPATGSFLLLQLDGNKIAAAAAVNAARDLKKARRLIQAGDSVDSRALADPQVALERVRV